MHRFAFERGDGNDALDDAPGASTVLLSTTVRKPLDSSGILAPRASKGAGIDSSSATLWKTPERLRPLFVFGPELLVNCRK
jgi:hypothetical protein